MVKEGKITVISENNAQAANSVVGITSPIHVNLFCAAKERTGTLEIVNTLNNYNPDMGIASFIFEIKATYEGQEVYSNLVRMNFENSGTKNIIIEGIPINKLVSVQEIYASGAYDCTSGIANLYTQANNHTIHYTNEYNNKDFQSTIAVMNFEYSEDGWNVNLEETEEEGYLPITIDISGMGWEHTIYGITSPDADNKFIRMSYFTIADCDVTGEGTNWENKQGKYYYSTVLQAGEATEPIVLKLNVPDDYEKNFRLILVMESTTAKTGEEGNLYADWD